MWCVSDGYPDALWLWEHGISRLCFVSLEGQRVLDRAQFYRVILPQAWANRFYDETKRIIAKTTQDGMNRVSLLLRSLEEKRKVHLCV